MRFNLSTYVSVYAHTFTYVYVDIESEIRAGVIGNRSLLTYSNIFQKCHGSRTLKKLLGNNFKQKITKIKVAQEALINSLIFPSYPICCIISLSPCIICIHTYFPLNLFEAEHLQLKPRLLKTQPLWLKERGEPGGPAPRPPLTPEAPLWEIFGKQLRNHSLFPLLVS